MDKAEAQKQLKNLEDKFSEEVAALRKIIEAPEVAPSLLTGPEPGSSKPYWVLGEHPVDGHLRAKNYFAKSPNTANYSHGNVFPNRDTASAHAEAISTMLTLRHQPGTVSPVSDKSQYLIDLDGDLIARVKSYCRADLKFTRLSPCFDTEEQAQVALDTLGADRVKRMFETLHGIKS
ncbi:hypothetical protein [Castellaniella sp.]|uniref:hypothetical protein n=1 Tax=Castellaniella sp. TaxID=1955812 RepID=UPI002AFEC903|nr:hypothetical protein [Castellaniella sp.]